MKNRNQKTHYFIFVASLGLTANAQMGIGNKIPSASNQQGITATDEAGVFPRDVFTSRIYNTTYCCCNC